MRVKRASFVLFELVDEQRVDLAALLRGEVDLTSQPPEIHALAPPHRPAGADDTRRVRRAVVRSRR